MLARARTSGLPFWIIVLLVRSLLGVRDREGRESLQRDGALIVVTSAVVVENETEEEPQVLELPSFDDEGKMHLASGRYKVSEGSGVVHLKAPLECEIHADGATLILDAPLEIDCPVHFYGKLSIWASKTDLAPLIRVNTDAVVHETADLMFQGLREFKTHEAMGGAFAVWGNLLLKGSLTISESKMPGGSGGSLFVRENFTQTGGTVKLSHSHAAHGGAMYVKNFNQSGGSFTILNASNAWNRWGLSGGALWVDKTFTQSGGTLVISESKAEARGGAIFAGSFSQSGGSIEIRNSTAKTLGGAIWINFNFHQSDGRLIISHSGAEKGAIYVQYNFIQSGGSLSISNSQARVTGGALYVGHNFTKSGGHFTTTNATARDSGGAVHVHEFFVQSGGDLVVSNARCTQKIAGGAISVFESFTFSGGSIEIMDVFAGALYIGRDFVQTDGSFSIDQSSSEYSGGAMFVSKNLHQSGGTLSISNSTSGRRGGSIYCGWNLVQSGGSINIKHSAARQSGGALNVAKNLSLHGSLKVRDATSEVDGGGVSVMGDLEMMNTSAIFRGCHAKTGGAMVVQGQLRMINTSLWVQNATADVSGAALFAANLTQIGGAMLVKESGGRGDILHIPGQWSLDSGSVQLQRCSSTTFAMHVGSCELRGFLEASNCSAPYGLLASAGPALVRNASFETSAVPQLRTSRAFVSDWQVTGSQAWIASGDVTQVHNLDCDADYGARSDETGAGCGNCTQGFTFLKNRSMATIWELQQMQGCALCPMGAVSCNSSRLEMPPGLTLEKGNISRSLHCPNPLACPGGLVSDASQQFCEEGYEGLGCSQCADHCGRSDSNVFVCLTCASGFLRAARDTVLFLAGDAIVFTMSAARVIGATSTNRNSAVYLNQLMAFAAATSPALLAVQQTATFRDQLNVLRRWIGIASVPVQIGDLGQSSTFVSAECLVTYLGLEPSLFSSHVLSAVVYVLLALILALRAGAGVALVVAVNCFLPKFCAAFGRYLICYRMEPADIQPEQQCLLDNKFLVLGRMLALVAIALCFIVGPGSWLKITQEKSLAEEPQVLYLTRSYHTGYETWEVERLVRKMCLKLVSTTFPVTLNPSTQMAGVNFILIASLSLHATNRPYMKAEWNRMELVLLVTASGRRLTPAVIIVLTTLCLANEIHWAHSARVQISLILTILVLLTSSGALLFALLLREFIRERQQKNQQTDQQEQPQ